MPGGLSPELPTEITIAVGPAASDQTLRWTIEALPADGDDPLAALDLSGPPFAVGIDGTGSSTHLSDASGLLTTELRATRSDSGGLGAAVDFAWESAVGRPIAEALPVIALRAALRSPNRMRFRVTGGPVIGQRYTLPNAGNDGAEQVVGVLTDLATIQLHTLQMVRAPDLETVTVGDVRSWAMAAQLLRGHTVVGPAMRVIVTPVPRPPQVGDVISPMWKQPFSVTVDGSNIDLGECAIVSLDMTVVGVAEREDGMYRVEVEAPDGKNDVSYAYWPYDRQPPPVPGIGLTVQDDQ
jgi:hypothetical protein